MKKTVSNALDKVPNTLNLLPHLQHPFWDGRHPFLYNQQHKRSAVSCFIGPAPESHPRCPHGDQSHLWAASEGNCHLKDNIISLERENTTIKREIGLVKESTNRSELASRYLTVRNLGMPVSAEESAEASTEDYNKAAVKNAYDKILHPILSVAKAKGHMKVFSWRPSSRRAFVSTATPRPTKGGSPTPLLSSSYLGIRDKG
jgi:hypothetical protein